MPKLLGVSLYLECTHASLWRVTSLVDQNMFWLLWNPESAGLEAAWQLSWVLGTSVQHLAHLGGVFPAILISMPLDTIYIFLLFLFFLFVFYFSRRSWWVITRNADGNAFGEWQWGAIKGLLIQTVHSLYPQLSLWPNYYAGSCLVSQQLGN